MMGNLSGKFISKKRRKPNENLFAQSFVNAEPLLHRGAKVTILSISG